MEKLIAHVVSSLILRGAVKDPRVDSLLSVSRVKVSRDLSTAECAVSGFLEPDRLKDAVDGLNSAAGFIQTMLGREMHTRNTPRLRFVLDEGVRAGFEMARKLTGISTPDEPDSPPHSD